MVDKKSQKIIYAKRSNTRDGRSCKEEITNKYQWVKITIHKIDFIIVAEQIFKIIIQQESLNLKLGSVGWIWNIFTIECIIDGQEGRCRIKFRGS